MIANQLLARRAAEHQARVSLGFSPREWRRRAALDRQLAAGVDPSTSDMLECRAAQLTTGKHRVVLATGFERVIEAAEEPPYALSSPDPLRRAEVLASRDVLLSLARELRSERSVRVRGVALAHRLLTDARGPLYAATSCDEVQQVAHAARDAL